MDAVPPPQQVESVDFAKAAKKAGKAKKFAKKLRSSFSRKSLESLESAAFGGGTPGVKEADKGKSPSKSKTSLELRVSSSFKRLRRKLSWVEGKSPRVDARVDALAESGNVNTIRLDEVISKGKANLALQPQDTVVQSAPDVGTDKQELEFAVQADGKLVEDAPENDAIQNDVTDGNDSESTTYPSTPDVGDDKPEQASNLSDSGSDLVAAAPSDVSDLTQPQVVQKAPETVEVIKDVLQEAAEAVKTSGESVIKSSDTAHAVVHNASGAVEAIQTNVEKDKNTIQISEESLYEITKAAGPGQAGVEKMPETPEREIEPTDDKVGEEPEAIGLVGQVTRPTEAPKPVVAADEDLRSHAVPLDSRGGDGIDEGGSDGDKSSNSLIAGDGASVGAASFRTRELNNADLNLGQACGEQAARTSEDSVVPKKKKGSAVGIPIPGKVGLVVSAAFLLVKLASKSR